MGQIKITTDSSCSLPLYLVKKYDISVIYLEIQFGNYIFQDCTEVTGSNLFEYHDRSGNFAAAIPVPYEAFPPFFEQFTEDNDHIIHIGSTVGSIRSYENAVIAAKHYPSVTVVDAGQVSCGMGLMILHAAILAATGVSYKDILAEIDRYQYMVYSSFLIGSMEYFYQSERCSNMTRHLTRMFHVRPSIKVFNGKLMADKMYQGDDDSIRAAYIADFLKRIQNMDSNILFITNSGCRAQFMERLYQEVADCHYFQQIFLVQDSAAISSHCGPNTFGMYCYSREELKGRDGRERFGVGRRRRYI